MAEIRNIPRRGGLGWLADQLIGAKEWANQAQVPVLGGVGDMFLGEAPEWLNDLSYGMSKTDQYGRIPIPDKRALDALFLAGDATALPAMAKAGGKAAAKQIDRAMVEGRGPLAQLLAPAMPMNVVKNRGGNWISGDWGSPERFLDELKMFNKPGAKYTQETVTDSKRPGIMRVVTRNPKGDIYDIKEMMKEGYDSTKALDDWIDSTLVKYVKRDMATPKDPVRLLADEGISHYDLGVADMFARDRPTDFDIMGRVREKAGFPREGMAKNNLAGYWERKSDNAINTANTAKTYQDPSQWLDETYHQGVLEDNPWVLDVARTNPDEVINTMASSPWELGFEHLIDELTNALDPDSGLPQNLRLTPEGLQGLSMAEAVKKVHGINQFRAEQAQKANLRHQAAAGIPVHKEYPEGYRWLEYKLRDDLPIDEAEPQLEQWLKSEGDTMGHCVGEYCNKVLAGSSRILSLRGPDGKSLATIELKPSRTYTTAAARLPLSTNDGIKFDYKYPGIKNEYIKWFSDNKFHSMDYAKKFWPWVEENYPDIFREVVESRNPDRIAQIKGPGNRTPDDSAIKYIQDFVRSGNWDSNIGDFGNTKLLRAPSDTYSSVDLPNSLMTPGRGLIDPKYYDLDPRAVWRDLGSDFATDNEWMAAARKLFPDMFKE